MIPIYQLVKENILGLKRNCIWSIYGTGIGAEKIWKLISELKLTENVKYIFDNPDSKKLKSVFHGYYVECLDDTKKNVDIVIIAAEMSHQIIYNRLKAMMKNTEIEIVDPFVYNSTVQDKIQFVEYLESYDKKEFFEPIAEDEFEFREGDPRVIAWYLPQYHQIDINNKYYGQGFTEWSNTTATMPQFIGHYQPHIPYDVGYYDLMNIDTLKRQCFLAKKYGIHGFGFFYYWFSGKRIMEKPVELFLNHKEIHMPFCLHWASESWSKTWDGGEKGLIFRQELPDPLVFWKDLAPYLKDDRYIKIDGKPLFIIYKCNLFEQTLFKGFLTELRKLAKMDGFVDLYIMLSTGNGTFTGYEHWGGDALVEYQPWRFCETAEFENVVPQGYLNPKFRGNIVDISNALRNKQYLCQYKEKNYFRCALTLWDNCARKRESNAMIMLGNTPEQMKQWLIDIINESKKIHTKEENIVFISSWNEWGEGSHLEPDYKYGYGWLNAVRNAIEETR